MATVRKFLVKGLNAVKTDSTVYVNLDHPFLSLIDVSRDIIIALILFLNCESLNPSGSSLTEMAFESSIEQGFPARSSKLSSSIEQTPLLDSNSKISIEQRGLFDSNSICSK